MTSLSKQPTKQLVAGVPMDATVRTKPAEFGLFAVSKNFRLFYQMQLIEDALMRVRQKFAKIIENADEIFEECGGAFA